MTLEELLNRLIEKGWKPFGNEFTRVYVLRDRINKWDFALHFEYEQNGTTRTTFRGRRQLVSKESGLWQFCVENGMIDGVDRWTLNARQKSIYDKYITSEKEYTPKMNYEYRLIESALKDESELEEFLLNNIKIDETE